MDFEEMAEMQEIESADSTTKTLKNQQNKQKRKKFIRKVECQVCGDVANDHVHYGATTCYSCRAFFRRSITSQAHYKCAKSNHCEINPQTRKQCQACRMVKCQEAGMKATWVMTDEEKQEKKEAAIAKKRLKEISGNQPVIEPVELPTSSYLQKRARFKQSQKRQNNDDRKSSSQNISYQRSRGVTSPEGIMTDSSEEIGYEEDFDGSLSRTSNLTDRSEPQLSPGNYSQMSPRTYLTEIPLPPTLTDSSALYATWEEHRNTSMVRHNSLGTELTLKESSLVNNLVNLEAESRENIAMNLITRDGIMQGFKTGASLRFDVLKEGYNTAVKRIAYFMRKIDVFQDFSMDDKRALIGNNCHMVVNIKSARLLSPKNTLQTQLKVAAMDSEALVESTTARIPRLEYSQFFKSPWCCDADLEDQYRHMMESIFSLEMDDTSCTLLVLIAMFDTSETGDDIQTNELYTTGIYYFDELEGFNTGNNKALEVCNAPIFPQHQITRRVVEDKPRAIHAQKYYLDLLHRYLTSKVGPVHSTSLMKSYCDVLNKLKEMRQIILAKSLQV